MRLLLAGRDRALVEMSTSTIGSQVGIIDGRVQGYGSSRPHVVIRVLEDELLELGGLPLTLVEDALVVNRTRSTLDGNVRAQVEVEFKWMRAASLHESTRQRVAVPVALAGIGEETNVMALAGNHDSEFGHPAAKLGEVSLHVPDLFLEHSCVLTPGGC